MAMKQFGRLLLERTLPVLILAALFCAIHLEGVPNPRPWSTLVK